MARAAADDNSALVQRHRNQVSPILVLQWAFLAGTRPLAALRAALDELPGCRIGQVLAACPIIQRGGEISSREHRINQEIRAREIRLIDESGKQLGIYPVREALQIAEDRGLDLVEVAPNANPPVTRLMDYGKYLYERTKKEREARRGQKVTEIKEVRLRPKIGEHDVDFKIRRMKSFLTSGAKVKVRVRFRGREITHPEVARDLLRRVTEALSDVAVVEQAPQMEGNTMLMLLAPAPAK